MNVFDRILKDALRQLDDLLVETKDRLRRIEGPRGPSFWFWVEIARTTIMNRDRRGFHSDGCAMAMAQAADLVAQSGGSKEEQIDAAMDAYEKHFFYSTPHEHPCDEWPIRAIMAVA